MPEAPSVSTAPPLPEKVNAPAPFANTTPATLRFAARTGLLFAAVPNEAVFVVRSFAGALPRFQLAPVEKSVPALAHVIAVCAPTRGITPEFSASNATSAKMVWHFGELLLLRI